jgi:hypothetical protein
MSELGDLVGILGAIDDAVVARPELLPQVAALLCPYRYDAVGWFQPFRAFWDSLSDESDERSTIPELGDAVVNLGMTVDDDFRPRDLARRLLAVALIARVFGDDYGPSGDRQGDSRAVLGVRGLAGSDDDAGNLLQLLAGQNEEQPFPDLSAWNDVMNYALAAGWIQPIAVQPAPCTGNIVAVTVKNTSLVAATITTSFCDDHLSFAKAEEVLDPSHWPDCLRSFWCSMDPIPDPDPMIMRYLETVSLSCGSGPEIRTALDFETVTLPDRVYVGYQMSDDQAQLGGDGIIIVDEGSVEVRRNNSGACVNTTKRILFDPQFLALNPYQLAMLSCALGYADAGTRLVYNCAHEPPDAQPTQPRDERKPTSPDDCAKYVDEVADAAKRCVAEWSALYADSYRKATAGTYTSDDFSRDLMSMSKRMAGETYRAIQLGLRGLQLAADAPAAGRTPPPRPPGDPPARAASAERPPARHRAKGTRKNQKDKGKS